LSQTSYQATLIAVWKPDASLKPTYK
jgi:hypothetical protein